MSTNTTIANARKDAGITQAYLAKQLGISRQTLSKFENEPGQMRIGMAQHAAHILGINLSEYIFVGESKER